MFIAKSVVAGLFALSAAAQAGSIPLSNFDAGMSGWTGGGGTASMSYFSSGGILNSGYVTTTDVAGGAMTLVSPTLGDLSAYMGGAFGFGYNVFALGAGNRYVPYNDFGLVTISSGNLHVSADLISNIAAANNIAETGWHMTSLDLSSASWTGNARLSQVLANVTSLSIVTEYDMTQRWPDEVVGIDNVAFTARPLAINAIPEPSTNTLMGLGLIPVAIGLRRRQNRLARTGC